MRFHTYSYEGMYAEQILTVTQHIEDSVVLKLCLLLKVI